MATLNVSLPDNLKTYVAQRVHNGEYSNASDYIRTLIRKDREHPAVPDIFHTPQAQAPAPPHG